MHLDHEKLDVHRVSVDFASWAYEVSRGLKGADGHNVLGVANTGQGKALRVRIVAMLTRMI